eukprot:XP_003724402.2 PREDICTED: myb-like protein X [Strongylocentrotus purpuratus]
MTIAMEFCDHKLEISGWNLKVRLLLQVSLKLLCLQLASGSVQALCNGELEIDPQAPGCLDDCEGRRFFLGRDGMCKRCVQCEPGFEHDKFCGDGENGDAVCIPCPEGHYSYNRYECLACRVCEKTVLTRECSATTDRQCGECLQGFYRDPQNPPVCCSIPEMGGRWDLSQSKEATPACLAWLGKSRQNNSYLPSYPIHLHLPVVVSSNSGSQLSTSPASSHTTLLGSGVTVDTDSRSLTCSPMEFQNTLKDKERDVDAIVDPEKEGVPASDVVSAEPKIKAKTAPERMESESTDGKMKDEQGLDSDASARSLIKETERREEETPAPARDKETLAPAGDKEMMGDGGEQKEYNDGDKVEQGGAAVDPQQSSTGETDGASSGSTWNRDADRVLLQACQEKGAREETFINVASQLTDKTPQQVKERFAILMKLFHHDEEPSNDEDDEEEESEGEEDEEEDEDDGGDETDS